MTADAPDPRYQRFRLAPSIARSRRFVVLVSTQRGMLLSFKSLIPG